MDVSPTMIEVGGYDQGFPAGDADKDEDEDLCRICRSPEEPGNPLRYPCACRGSIKYVHQECLRLWLNRRGYKKCEVCGRSYSFVRVYSENAPERLPFHEFLMGLLLRVARYVKWIAPWIVLILLNTYCSSLIPCCQELAVDFQREYGISWKFASLWAGLFYNCFIVCFMTIISFIVVLSGDLISMRFTGWFIFFGNGLGQRVIAGVVQVLWRYLKILCNWYMEKFINLFDLREPLGLVNVDLNAPLHEFGAIRRMLFFLDDNAFASLAISIYLPILFILMPYSVGWIVLATVGGSYLSGNLPFILGYIVMLSISSAYLGILFTMHRNPFPAIVRWIFQGLLFIAVKFPIMVKWFFLGLLFIMLIFPYLLWVLLVKACKNLYIIKDAFVLCLKLGVLPCLIGCWFIICTSPMSGITISRMHEISSHFAYLMILQWLMGSICLMIAFSYVRFVQKIIHKRAFWYLLDITDPDYKITKLNLGYTFFAFACHGVLLVILFHLPVKAITLISPSFFPLELSWVTDEKLDVGTHAVSFYITSSGGYTWLFNLMKAVGEFILHKWIITISSWLQLSDFLLIVPQGEGFHRADQNVIIPLLQPRRQLIDNSWLLFYAIAEGSVVCLHGSHNVEDDDVEGQRDNRFMLRIALMLVVAALSLFLFSTIYMTLPVLVGRAFIDSISFILRRFGLKHDDFCAFWIGCHILRAIYITTCFVHDHIQKGRTDLLIKYISTSIQYCLLFSIWITIIPGLVGLLIDLMIIIPLRVPVDESPILFLFQDWLIGVVMLHIWILLAMLTPINCFATEAWRRKLERISNEGIERVPTLWLLRDVFGSMINTLLTTLCYPYLLVKTLFPLFGYPESVNSAIDRFIWPALLALIVVWFVAKLTLYLIVYLHQLIFDERYLVGERVNDLTEDIEQGLIIIRGV